MDDKDFSDILNNMKDLTLRQIVRLFKKLKYKTILALVLFIVSVIGGSFIAGKYSHQQDTAVMLEKPFSMRIKYGDKQHDFDKLVLIKDPTSVIFTKNQVVLSLREIHNAFDVSQIGKVIAVLDENKISSIWKMILSGVETNIVYAKSMIFSWNGHSNDYSFKEKFVNGHTVHRYYSDGCTLSYNVDNNRRSIPGSFKWINRSH